MMPGLTLRRVFTLLCSFLGMMGMARVYLSDRYLLVGLHIYAIDGGVGLSRKLPWGLFVRGSSNIVSRAWCIRILRVSS